MRLCVSCTIRQIILCWVFCLWNRTSLTNLCHPLIPTDLVTVLNSIPLWGEGVHQYVNLRRMRWYGFAPYIQFFIRKESFCVPSYSLSRQSGTPPFNECPATT